MDWVEKTEAVRADRSYADLERAAGITPNTLSEKMRLRRTLNVDDGLSLARVLGVDPNWLFNDRSGLPAIYAIDGATGSPEFRAAVLAVLADAFVERASAAVGLTHIRGPADRPVPGSAPPVSDRSAERSLAEETVKDRGRRRERRGGGRSKAGGGSS